MENLEKLMSEYIKRRNKNRRYMKLEVWQKALKVTAQISDDQFQQIDSLHYEVENKLLHLVESLENKRDNGTWLNRISDGIEEYYPLVLYYYTSYSITPPR